MANKLKEEKSLYLKQHANNPVHWYPWGEEPFEKAKLEGKPVIISIGYAACHWCHVMERESFEDEDTAAFMNDHFVCIKIDREEHPEVDSFYMDAVTAISGSGGWPLNVFTTPDRLPFYGGTYFPPRPAYQRPSWLQVLYRMAEIWQQQKENVENQAEGLLSHIKQMSAFEASNVQDITDEDCQKIAEDLLKRADRINGGFGSAPKFPGTMAIGYLMEYYIFHGQKDALEHALFSLDAMANGGIYDQAGGGFARYSTDSKWLVPHFEKMLYDNALFIRVYSEAYAITKSKSYKRVIEETISFIEAELKSPGGGYYCSLDADSEGEEGKFYVWTWEKWQEIFGDKEEVITRYFKVTEHGNWEGKNILNTDGSIEEFAQHENLQVEIITEQILAAKNEILNARSKRTRPVTDDKILLSWNALMNQALVKAALTTGTNDLISKAEKHMVFLWSHFIVNGQFLHSKKNETEGIEAGLEDYAFLIESMLKLASANGDVELLKESCRLTEFVEINFSDEQEVYFYSTTASKKDLPIRKIELYDGVTPSANAVMAHNLMICGMLNGENRQIERAIKMLKNIKSRAVGYSYSFAYWSVLMERYIRGIKIIVCSGIEAQRNADQILTKNLPQVYVFALKKEIFEIPLLEKKYFEHKTHIFVCSFYACELPVNTVDEALQVIG